MPLPLFSSFLPLSPPLSLLSSPKFSPVKTVITSRAQESKPSTPLCCNADPNDINNPNTNNLIRAPTAPWMRSPLLLPPDQLVSLSRPRSKTLEKSRSNAYRSLTQKVRGGRSRQNMKKVISSIAKLQELDREVEEEEEEAEASEIGTGLPWAKVEERMVFRREKKERVETVAERVLDREVLERMRAEARGMRVWVRAKKAGVTREVVEEILKGWRTEELVMVKFVEPLKRNMDRAREIVEIKTGGLVVWSKKDALVVYRGKYQSTTKLFQDSNLAVGCVSSPSTIDSAISSRNTIVHNAEKYVGAGHSQFTRTDCALHKESLYEREANRLLDGLGPRFIDWWWRKPLPVDADLLPEVVPEFKPPFRLCPPRDRPKLRDDELTYLRKLARPLPTHFALSKNRRLQGLAAAIIKLWESSHIAKIAIKVGIHNTDSRQMAEELKRLTGGVTILRNKFFIILYRGKDFLPGKVASSIHEREIELHEQQLQEEDARAKAIESYYALDESMPMSSNIGTFTEFKDIQASYLPVNNGVCVDKVKIEAEKENLVTELKDEEHKLSILMLKIEKSERELAKLNSSWSPSEQSADGELLTEEERQSFIKVGLKMDECLLLGRRGVYDGTIESIHQHWKHREVVKIITMQSAFHQITYAAKLLEVESSGILVAVEKLKRGHAIIIYRGKNYGRKLKTPENLLTKREALQKSIEIQRRGSMKYFAWQKQRRISELRQRLRYLEQRAKKLVTRDAQDRS